MAKERHSFGDLKTERRIGSTQNTHPGEFPLPIDMMGFGVTGQKLLLSHALLEALHLADRGLCAGATL